MADTITDAIVPEVLSRDEIVRVQVRELINEIGNKFLALAFAMYEIWENGYYIKYGHSNFKSYCEDEAGYGHAKSKGLIAIAAKVKSLKLNLEEVEEIGWVKMRMIINVLDDKNKKVLMQSAMEKSAPFLLADVRQYRSKSINKVERNVTLKLQMTEDQSSIVMDSIEKAKSSIDSENTSKALEHIAYEWVMGAGQETTVPLKTVVAWVEKTYDVTLKVIKNKGSASIKGLK